MKYPRFYTPNNFSGCTTEVNAACINHGFIPLTILVGVQPLGRSMTSNQGFIPLTILVGVQLQILLGASCAIFLTE